MKLSQLNLNLLITLEVLLSESHVSHAAKRLFVSQSALSCSLNQLRDMFQDELLVREGRRMVLTPRAQALLPHLKYLVQYLTNTLEQYQGFNPATSERVFTIGMTEYADFLLLPTLYTLLNQQAPYVTLRVKHLIPMGTKPVFENGEIELGVGMLYELPHLVNDILFTERMVCLARAGHPLFKKRLSLKSYNQAGHIDFSLRDQVFFGISNEAISHQGVTRRVQLVAAHLVPALDALVNSDLIATVQAGVAKRACQWFNLIVQPPPFKLPDVTFAQIWHRRYQQDVGHQWLRHLIQTISQKIHKDRLK